MFKSYDGLDNAHIILMVILAALLFVVVKNWDNLELRMGNGDNNNENVDGVMDVDNNGNMTKNSYGNQAVNN